MKLMSIYDQIMRFEPLDDLDALFSNLDSFEEVPLISRQTRIDQAEKILDSTNISEFLVGLAFFMINAIRTAKTGNLSCGMVAITYTDFDDDYADRTLVPNLFVYPGSDGHNFHQTLKDQHGRGSSPQMDTIRSVFRRCGIENSFSFFESRFHDHASGEDLVRIFALPKA